MSDANTQELTLGEKRVRVTFNPSNKSIVDQIKQKSAELINMVCYDVTAGNTHADPEQMRLINTAMTKIEEAAMWAVKAATYA